MSTVQLWTDWLLACSFYCSAKWSLLSFAFPHHQDVKPDLFCKGLLSNMSDGCCSKSYQIHLNKINQTLKSFSLSLLMCVNERKRRTQPGYLKLRRVLLELMRWWWFPHWDFTWGHCCATFPLFTSCLVLQSSRHAPTAQTKLYITIYKV